MPRKSKKLAKPQRPPAATLGEPNPAAPAADKRSPGGHFLPNNSGGPGNPHARHCARMLEMFRNAIADEEMYLLSRVLFEKAAAGDMSALKMVWQYKLGKPLPAPNPDALDRDEWDHYQKDGTTLDEMKQALSRLPSHVGNAIVSAALPTIADSVSQTLSEQLIQSLPPDYWAQRQQQANEAAQVQTEVETPAQPASSDMEDPFAITEEAAYRHAALNSPAPTPDVTRTSAGSNGNFQSQSTVNRSTSPTKSGTGSNGNSKPESTANRSTAANKPGTGSNGNSKPESTASKSSANPKSGTGSNGKAKAKKKGNAFKKQWSEPNFKKCKAHSKRKKQRVGA
ncbi:hypothetical protein BH10PLA2_BH10PLA2_31940 [soil metagenome]